MEHIYKMEITIPDDDNDIQCFVAEYKPADIINHKLSQCVPVGFQHGKNLAEILTRCYFNILDHFEV